MSGGLHEGDRTLVTSATRYRDYILSPYAPRCDPTGKLHALSVLRHALRHEGLLDAAWPMIERLRAHLGEDETVWGLKYGAGKPSLELYFYRFDSEEPRAKSVTALQQALAPLLHFESEMDEVHPYFMCSFEVDGEALASGAGGHFRVYSRTGDENRRECGFSYRLDGARLTLENHYWFYYAERGEELEDAVRRVQHSPRSGSKACWSTLLPKYLRDCFTICYAVKPRSDALYYSRIDGAQLSRFLAQHVPDQTAALRQALSAHADELAHLSWDLGFDFCARPSDTELSISKVGIHGVF